MINFIIVDDIKKYSDLISSVVTKVMMKNHFVYKTYVFNEYDDSFYKIMESDLPNKIYIMDIETKEASGIDIARRIRKFDVDSIIIFVTVYNEAGMVLLQDDLMFLTFISKFDDFENKLYDSYQITTVAVSKTETGLLMADLACGHLIPESIGKNCSVRLVGRLLKRNTF